MHMHAKRHLYMRKETYVCEKRHICIKTDQCVCKVCFMALYTHTVRPTNSCEMWPTYAKRDTYVRKQTYVCTKYVPWRFARIPWDQQIDVKRDLHMRKETHICEIRPTYAKQDLSMQRICSMALCAQTKRPMYICQTWPIYAKRDLHMRQETYTCENRRKHKKTMFRITVHACYETYMHSSNVTWKCEERPMYAKRDLYMQKGTYIRETVWWYCAHILVDLHSTLCTHKKRGMHTHVKRDLHVAVCTQTKRPIKALVTRICKSTLGTVHTWWERHAYTYEVWPTCGSVHTYQSGTYQKSFVHMWIMTYIFAKKDMWLWKQAYFHTVVCKVETVGLFAYISVFFRICRLCFTYVWRSHVCVKSEDCFVVLCTRYDSQKRPMYAKRDLCMRKETNTCTKGLIHVRLFRGIVHTY